MAVERMRALRGARPLAALCGVATALGVLAPHVAARGGPAPHGGRTAVSILGDSFHINGRPTYAGRRFRGHDLEGLLLNSRMVQGIFDDQNPETAPRWAYPDTGQWDAERNTREFLAAMPEWRRHGLLAFTINLQGGSPRATRRDSRGTTRRSTPTARCARDYLARLRAHPRRGPTSWAWS